MCIYIIIDPVPVSLSAVLIYSERRMYTVMCIFSFAATKYKSTPYSSLQLISYHAWSMLQVKAIAWSPHQHGLLASGGGTADRCIRFWNTLTGQPLQSVDTGSQVCNLAWSKHSNELVSNYTSNCDTFYS